MSGHDFFTDYLPTMKDLTSSTDHAVISAMKMLISMNLEKAYYLGDKGRVMANLSFIYLAPSGASKTPIIKVLKSMYRMNHVNFSYLFARFSIQAIQTILSKLSEDLKNSDTPFPMMIIRDEVSTLAKDSKNGAMSTTFEFLSQLHDGKDLDPYTTLRGGHETFPRYVYCSMWFTGTPIFLNYIDDEFWEQGFGLRALFVKEEPIRLFTKPADGLGYDLKIEMMMKEMQERYISIWKRIRKVKATPEFVNEWYNYANSIMEKRREAQINNDDSIDIRATTKYPETVLKLAIIYAASRVYYNKNYEEDRDSSDYSLLKDIDVDLDLILHMDVSDLHNAINDLEDNTKIMKEYYIDYLQRKSFKITGTNLDRLITQFIDKYKKVKRRFNVIDNGEDTDNAIESNKGEWVVISDITRGLNWSKSTKEMVLNSLADDEVIELVWASTGSKKISRLVRLQPNK